MTAQIHERLIYDGTETSMAFCPPLPKGEARVVPNEDQEARSEYSHSGCWRGYQGTWEIRDGRLSLLELAGRVKLAGADPLFAEWFSGTLRIPRGELLQYVHMGFGSVFEEELHVEIVRGEVTSSRVFDNRGRDHDPRSLARQNLPGSENRFDGDGRSARWSLSTWIARALRRLLG